MVNPITESFFIKEFPVDVIKANPPNQVKHLILLIPGNPGLVGYYKRFIVSLYKELNGTAAVWAMSHSCHSKADNPNQGQKNLSPLELEIEHKLQFLQKHVPDDCKITLIGHSIGCYMIIKVLDTLRCNRNISPKYSRKFPSNLYERIDKSFLLFPTIERMRESPNGKKLWPLLCYFPWFVHLLVFLLNGLPLAIRKGVSYVASSFSPHDDIVETTTELLTPRLVKNMLSLAQDELNTVTCLNEAEIRNSYRKICFYFGTCDGWCPLHYRDDLVSLIPEVKCITDSHNIKHAFPLMSSELMASILAKEIVLEDS